MNADLQDFGRRWVDAELRADVDSLDALLDDDFIAVGPLGFLLTKAQWLDRHRGGDLKYQSMTWEPGSIRTFGEVAVIIGTQTADSTYQDNPVPFQTLRVTQIAVNRDERWLLAGLHMSQLAEPPRPS
jgi:hypothetical protein